MKNESGVDGKDSSPVAMDKQEAAVYTLGQQQEQEEEHELGYDRDHPPLPNTPDDGRF